MYGYIKARGEMNSASTYRDFSEYVKKERKHCQVNSNPLPAKTFLKILWHGIHSSCDVHRYEYPTQHKKGIHRLHKNNTWSYDNMKVGHSNLKTFSSNLKHMARKNVQGRQELARFKSGSQRKKKRHELKKGARR